MKKTKSRKLRKNQLANKYNIRHIASVDLFADWVINVWLLSTEQCDTYQRADRLFYAFAVSLAAEHGLPQKNILRILQQLSKETIKGNTIHLKATFGHDSEWTSTLQSQSATLAHLLVNENILSGYASLEKIKTHLDDLDISCNREYKTTHAKSKRIRINAISRSTQASQTAMPNWILSTLRRWPAPTNPLHENPRANSTSTLIAGQNKKTATYHFKQYKTEGRQIIYQSADQLHLYTFYNRISMKFTAIQKKEKKTKIKTNDSYIQYLDELLSEMNTGDPLYDMKEFLISWYLWFLNKGYKPAVAKQYTSTFFRHFIICYADCSEFLHWENSVITERIEESLDAKSLRHKTKTKMAKAQHIKSMQTYMKKERKITITGLNLEVCEGEYFCNVRRTLVYPYQLDDMIEIIQSSDNLTFLEKKQQIAAFVIAFYTGIRPSELLALTINCITPSKFLIILGGKSRSARRKLPLMNLVPHQYHEYITDYIERRKDEFRKYKNYGTISLFGFRGSKDPYSYYEFIDPINAFIKEQRGKEYTLYSFRHSFASWSILRLYYIQQPTVRKYIPDYDHPLFSPENMSQFSKLFIQGFGDHLMVLAEHQGHFDTLTLLKHYIHTFHIIQKHAVEKIDTEFDEPLTNAQISALCPNARSRTTLAKIKPKNWRALLEFIET